MAKGSSAGSKILINSAEVERVFNECLVDEVDLSAPQEAGESHPQDSMTFVESISSRIAFHTNILEHYRGQIGDWLKALPYQFHKNGGGGWSLLNGCVQENGEQWTDFQCNVERLFVLGMGLGEVKFFMDRKFWGALPGGVPYYVIDIE